MVAHNGGVAAWRLKTEQIWINLMRIRNTKMLFFEKGLIDVVKKGDIYVFVI
jgi:hypothetical protein